MNQKVWYINLRTRLLYARRPANLHFEVLASDAAKVGDNAEIGCFSCEAKLTPAMASRRASHGPSCAYGEYPELWAPATAFLSTAEKQAINAAYGKAETLKGDISGSPRVDLSPFKIDGDKVLANALAENARLKEELDLLSDKRFLELEEERDRWKAKAEEEQQRANKLADEAQFMRDLADKAMENQDRTYGRLYRITGLYREECEKNGKKL